MKSRVYFKVRTSVFIHTENGNLIQVCRMNSYLQARKYWQKHKEDFKRKDGSIPKAFFLHKYSERYFTEWLNGETQ